jgi:hypothetical protein
MKNYKDFLEDLKKGEIKKIIIFEGKDTYLMKKSWEALCRATNSEYHFYTLDEDIKTNKGREEFIKRFSELDVFSLKRKVFLLYLDRFPVYLKVFLKEIEEINSNNILILIIPETEYDKKNFLELSKYEIYRFDGLEEEDAYKWISRQFTKMGKILSKNVINFLIESSKGNFGKIYNVLQIVSLAFEEKSISSSSFLKDILKEVYDSKEIIDSIEPGKKISSLLSKFYKMDFKENEINSILNMIMKRLYNNRKQFMNDKEIYEIIYELSLLQKEMQTKVCNKRILFLTGLMNIFLKKEVYFGISGIK